MNLQWRNWTPADNYAAGGTADLERLLYNLEQLAACLRTDFAMEVTLPLPSLDGYATLPFAHFLQRVEESVQAVGVFALAGWQAPRVWQAGAAIAAADPNRWEQNGRLVEQNIERGKTNMLRCGRFSTGRRF